ncbi:Hypothetical predicted protein [Paramuricea clavata]|uniref:Uncharacterized protein n=1 Tax=Paramuricea clavata TaxID=317549 RepID=A0A6S7J2U1_PARCT|nr:Hypothetical predicted protein [Paramuricea clavata]
MQQCAIFNLGNATVIENGYETQPVQKQSKDTGATDNATAMENGHEIHPVQKQSKAAGVTGFNNQAFAPVTPTAPPPEACNEDEYVVPNYPRGPAGNGRLPSVETSERALPAIKNKPRLPSIANKKKRAPNLEKGEDAYENVT